jgi:hypothetical protein
LILEWKVSQVFGASRLLRNPKAATVDRHVSSFIKTVGLVREAQTKVMLNFAMFKVSVRTRTRPHPRPVTDPPANAADVR